MGLVREGAFGFALLPPEKRVVVRKLRFCQRYEKSARGVITDHFDRTEFQVRGACHSHRLEWYELRDPPPGRPKPIEPVQTWSVEKGAWVTREVVGASLKQRPSASEAKVLEKYQEDEMYYNFKMARVCAELIRPDVRGIDDEQRPWGGYEFDSLVVTGYARAVQTRNGCSELRM